MKQPVSKPLKGRVTPKKKKKKSFDEQLAYSRNDTTCFDDVLLYGDYRELLPKT